jgi:hypothetical protein
MRLFVLPSRRRQTIKIRRVLPPPSLAVRPRSASIQPSSLSIATRTDSGALSTAPFPFIERRISRIDAWNGQNFRIGAKLNPIAAQQIDVQSFEPSLNNA